MIYEYLRYVSIMFQGQSTPAPALDPAGHEKKVLLHVALHPGREITMSEYHSRSMNPVVDVNGLGRTAPDHESRSFDPRSAHEISRQLQAVRVSYPDSVSNAVKVRVTADAPVGAMMPDIVSEFP